MEENQTQETKNSMNPGVIIAVIIVAALIGYGAWTMSKSSQKPAEQTNSMQMEKTPTITTDSTQPTATEESNPTTTETTPGSSEVKVVAVEAGSFYYKPNEIHVKKGEKVKIVMTSKDMMHDFTIDALGVKMPVTKAGETGTVEFTADKTGTFEYYCSVGQHRKMGQVGKLIVE